MKKSTLIMALALILSLALGVGGTLAYLTDRDSETNIFTLGNVDIELNEDFNEGEQLLPGQDVNKDVTIENVGTTDAWVWYTLAIPAALDNPEASSDNVIHTNVPGKNWLGYQNNKNYWDDDQTEATPEDQCWIVDAPVFENGATSTTIEIDGVVYNLYAHLYNGALAAGEETTVGLTQVYMDDHIDIDPDGNLHHVVGGVVEDIDWNINEDGNPVIFVNAYAVQKEGFDTVQEAFKAYIGQWGELNGTYETAVKADDAAALEAAINDGASIIELGAGTYKIPAAAKGKDITIVGSKETVIDATASYGQSLSGADITLSGVTVKGQASGNYAGFTHIGSMTLNGCDIEGKITLYAPTVFNDCTLTNMKDYNVWTWGANEVEFNNCTFVTGGKALLVYGGASESSKHVDVTVNDCVFESDGSVATNKAAIETGDDYEGTSYNIVINDITVDSDFGTGENTDTNIWANKNNMPTDELNVVIDGVDKY